MPLCGTIWLINNRLSHWALHDWGVHFFLKKVGPILPFLLEVNLLQKHLQSLQKPIKAVPVAALHMAAANGHEGVVKILLERGAVSL
jgi:hypothetical protein